MLDLSFTKNRYFTNGVSGGALFSTFTIILILLEAVYLYGLSQPGERVKKTGPVPLIPLTDEPVIFQEDDRWAASSPGSADLWKKEIQNGFTHSIVIEDPRKYGLPLGVPARPGAERYGLSMYHQLHCLASIRETFYHKSELTSHVHMNKLRNQANESFLVQHIDHCFDYLRQSIRCSADLSVEWARVGSTENRNSVDGWGVPHMECKDSDAIEAFVLQHRF
ncbi:hypothetical protein LOZ58_002852 [Ophidiomyces ophidiicola]|nr:hypothetical protein LOZ58_002852 [Ophidiomyces ophidiicola]